jgi:hypothetical protein
VWGDSFFFFLTLQAAKHENIVIVLCGKKF